MKNNLDKDNINKLCEKCIKRCKQNKSVTLVSCPSYKMKPQQLEFKFTFKKLNKDKKNNG